MTKDSEASKIERVLKMIILLGREPQTVNALQIALGKSPGTIRRYFVLLENVGFKIQKTSYGKYSIENMNKLLGYENHNASWADHPRR